MTSPPAERGRILVVEDGAMNRVALTRALELRGHEVHAVVDGVEAIDALNERPFDVVLLDIGMPRKDGFETLAEIKADPALREIPVIMISGVADMPSIVRCIEMGALDHLSKPFEPALLEARIGAALSAKRLRDLELEYLDQVGRLTGAAESLEADAFEAHSLDEVVARSRCARRFGQDVRKDGRRGARARGRSAPPGARADHRDRRNAPSAQGRGDHRQRLLPLAAGAGLPTFGVQPTEAQAPSAKRIRSEVCCGGSDAH